jgi:hypothetical protein
MRAKPMKTATGLAIAVAVAVTGAALSGDATASVQGDKAKEDKSARVCRTVTPTSSRLTRRVCRSQADWDSTQQKAQDGLLDQQLKETTLFEQAPRP